MHNNGNYQDYKYIFLYFYYIKYHPYACVSSKFTLSRGIQGYLLQQDYSIVSSIIFAPDVNIETKRELIPQFNYLIKYRDRKLHELMIYEELEDKVIFIFHNGNLLYDIRNYIVQLMIRLISLF